MTCSSFPVCGPSAAVAAAAANEGLMRASMTKPVKESENAKANTDLRSTNSSRPEPRPVSLVCTILAASEHLKKPGRPNSGERDSFSAPQHRSQEARMALSEQDFGQGTAQMRAPAQREIIYRHSLAVRLTHWINVLCLTLLLMSGLAVFNVHPSLYWGHYGY